MSQAPSSKPLKPDRPPVEPPGGPHDPNDADGNPKSEEELVQGMSIAAIEKRESEQQSAGHAYREREGRREGIELVVRNMRELFRGDVRPHMSEADGILREEQTLGEVRFLDTRFSVFFSSPFRGVDVPNHSSLGTSGTR